MSFLKVRQIKPSYNIHSLISRERLYTLVYVSVVTIQSALDQARAIKQQGNEFFKQQKFDEAIRCYQEAIKVCPEETTADIAIFHQNIGAVYDQMVGMWGEELGESGIKKERVG